MIIIIGSSSTVTQLTSKWFKSYRPEGIKDIDLISDLKSFDKISKLLSDAKVTQIRPNKFAFTGSSKLGGLPLEVEVPHIDFPSVSFLLSKVFFTANGYYDYYTTNIFSREFCREFPSHLNCVPIIPSLNFQFVLKKSHRFLKNSPHFWKTVRDYNFLKSLIDLSSLTSNPELREFLRIREEETYNYKHPSLAVNKVDFFTDNVPYVYNHDDIHEAIKLGEVPAYTKYLADGQEVMCDRNKFFTLSNQERINGVLEEAYTLAIERSQVPFPNMDPKKSFLIALSKVCTSITSGWFREFAYDNIIDILLQYSQDYVSKFKHALANGKIRLHDKQSSY